MKGLTWHNMVLIVPTINHFLQFLLISWCQVIVTIDNNILVAEVNFYYEPYMNSSIVLNSNFSLWTFHLYVAIFQQHLHMNYISFLWYHIIQLVVPFKIYLIDCCSLQNKQVHQGFLLVVSSCSTSAFIVLLSCQIRWPVTKEERSKYCYYNKRNICVLRFPRKDDVQFT
jgi:hypothetical protein